MAERFECAPPEVFPCHQQHTQPAPLTPTGEKTMTKYIDTLTRSVAKKNGYTRAEIEAGVTFFKRKERLSNPPGNFDKAGRFEAAERTYAVMSVRSPSRAHPYPEMSAARTSKHCAELFEVDALAVKRIARVLDLENNLPDNVSQHAFLAATVEASKILKPMKRVVDAA
jgi:hypothetical protein